MVCNVELVVLHFIIRAPILVFALAEFVVAAAVFETAPVDGGGDGGCITYGVIIT